MQVRQMRRGRHVGLKFGWAGSRALARKGPGGPMTAEQRRHREGRGIGAGKGIDAGVARGRVVGAWAGGVGAWAGGAGGGGETS